MQFLCVTLRQVLLNHCNVASEAGIRLRGSHLCHHPSLFTHYTYPRHIESQIMGFSQMKCSVFFQMMLTNFSSRILWRIWLLNKPFQVDVFLQSLLAILQFWQAFRRNHEPFYYPQSAGNLLRKLSHLQQFPYSNLLYGLAPYPTSGFSSIPLGSTLSSSSLRPSQNQNIHSSTM